jgi:exodeoxyribonuclease-1
MRPRAAAAMKFVFYDTETTGINEKYDQLLQFAAILTDGNLNPLDRFSIRCRLLPHIVPSPEALLVNRVTPSQLTDPAVPSHYQAIAAIQAKLAEWSPAIFLGYNSIRFDEEIMRQAFYQTLHPLFVTNTNGSARGDVMRMFYAASVLACPAIKIPTDDKGQPRFKLTMLAEANGYRPKVAHEAMADVETTIYLARLLKENALHIWAPMLEWTSKDAVSRFLADEEVVSFTEFYYGRPSSWLITCCGRHPANDSALLAWDLEYDPQKYIDLPATKLVDLLNGKSKIIREVRANAQPILMPIAAVPAGLMSKKLSAEELHRRAHLLYDNRVFQSRLNDALAATRATAAPAPPSPHLEDRIYDAFASTSDRTLMNQFHQAKWPDRAKLVEQIEDPRCAELARRLIHIEQPELLPEAERIKLDAWRANRILATDRSVPWMTVPKAYEEVGRLQKTATPEESAHLKDVKGFLDELSARYQSRPAK